jgi:hypothetical protein
VRAGMIAAAVDAPNTLVGYDKGSTVICAHCFVPLYRLERGIGPGEKASRTVDAFRPISRAELQQLRREVTSIHAALKPWTADDERNHVHSIGRPKTGDPAVCPACQKSFVQVFAPEAGEVIDRAYTWRLVTIPPLSDAYPIRSSHVDL